MLSQVLETIKDDDIYSKKNMTIDKLNLVLHKTYAIYCIKRNEVLYTDEANESKETDQKERAKTQ